MDPQKIVQTLADIIGRRYGLEIKVHAVRRESNDGKDYSVLGTGSGSSTPLSIR